MTQTIFTLAAMVSLLMVALFDDDDDYEYRRFNKENKVEEYNYGNDMCR